MINKEIKLTRPARTEINPFVESTPLGFMRRVTPNIERIFEDYGGFNFPNFFGRDFFPMAREFESEIWKPALEVREKDGKFFVHMELPGLKKEDVKVELTTNLLTLSGERKKETEEKREGYFRTERSYGSFYRTITLPEGARIDTATARMVDGVLEITVEVPKAEKIRTLEIKEGGNALKAKAVAK